MKRLKPMPWQVWNGPQELVVLVINKHGQPQAFQRGWEPERLWPQTKQTLVASLFHIDEVVTVVMADGFEDLIERTR